MENCTASVMLNELALVHELARKLSNSLHQSSQLEICRTIAMEIIFTVEKAICMAKATGTDGVSESQISNSRGQYSDNQQMLKKRKMLPTWTGQVSASTLRGSEGLPDDGYTWRKYGQKDILNMKYPRAYYRCTHRKRHGCLAMKQVQRSDNDPSVFDITYRGTHSCSSTVQLQDPHHILFDQLNSRALDNSQKRLRMKTESFALEAQDSTSSIFFPSTPLNPEEDLFCSSSNLESNFLASFCSAFMSPTTSESNGLPSSPCQKSNQENPKVGLTDAISKATSMTNSTMMDEDLILTTGKMDTSFPIETSNFYEWNSAAYDCLLNS